MRLALVLLALAQIVFRAEAAAQGFHPGPAPAFGELRPAIDSGSGVLMRLPLTVSGGLIPGDANTVAHVYWNGTALVDTKGNAWAMSGTVPQSTTGAFTQSRGVAGSFASDKFYSLATDALNVVQFSTCVVFNPASATDYLSLLTADDAPSTVGWRIYTGNSNAAIVTRGAGGAILSASGAVTVGGVNVLCAGRATNGNMTIRLNALSTRTVGATSQTVFTGAASRLGLSVTSDQAFIGTIYEVWFSTTPPSDALFTKIQQGVFGMLGTKNEPISDTRTAATYTGSDSQTYTAPANVLRVTTAGAVISAGETVTVTAPARAKRRAWTVDGVRTHGAVTGGSTVTLPEGTVRDVVLCGRYYGCQ